MKVAPNIESAGSVDVYVMCADGIWRGLASRILSILKISMRSVSSSGATRGVRVCDLEMSECRASENGPDNCLVSW